MITLEILTDLWYQFLKGYISNLQLKSPLIYHYRINSLKDIFLTQENQDSS